MCTQYADSAISLSTIIIVIIRDEQPFSSKNNNYKTQALRTRELRIAPSHQVAIFTVFPPASL